MKPTQRYCHSFVLTLSLAIISLLSLKISAQVGIGTLTPDSSSILELSSSQKGFLMPRMSTSQRDAIVSPAVGLQLFNTDDHCIDLYDGTNWNKNCSGSWTSEGPLMYPTSAQYVGIGTTDPDTSAILDLSSTNKGFLMPRMSTSQRDAIVSPAVGLQLFNTDDHCIDLYDGTNWNKNCSGSWTSEGPLMYPTSAQYVGIGTSEPDTSAILDLSSTNKGFLMPRMSTSQRDAIVSPAVGLQLFNTDDQCIDLYDGTNWNKNCSGSWTSEGPLMYPTSAQYVGIGTSEPDTSAMLDLSSTNKGFLMPRMSTSQRDAIVSPAVGLQLLNTDDQCIDLYDGVYWIKNCGLKQVGVGDSIGTNVWAFLNNNGPGVRENAFSFSIGTSVYIGTGSDGLVNYDDLWEFNTVTGIWTQKASMPGGVRNYAIGMTIGNKGYAGLGNNSGTYKLDFYEYDPVANTWTQKSNFGGAARRGAAGFVIDGKAYVGTGFNGTVTYNDLWSYDPGTNSWASKAPLPGVTRSEAIGFAIDSFGYMGMGYNLPNYLSDFYRYDADNNTWTTMTSYEGGGRRGAFSFEIDQYGYVGAGQSATSQFENDFWQYSPAENDWIEKTTYGGSPRKGTSASVVNGIGYVARGELADGGSGNDLWQYRPTVLAPEYSQSLPEGGFSSMEDDKWAIDGYALHTLNSRYVGIGTSTPDTNAMLDISSITKGLLIPRLTTAQRLAIAAPSESLLVYDVNKEQFYYFLNQSWISFLGSTGGINESNKSIAIGDSAMLNNSNLYGINNTAFGSAALRFNTNGTHNLAVAVNALYSNTNGEYNIGIGPSSLYSNTLGSSNIAIGTSALESNSSGNSNIGIGIYSLTDNTTGTKNISIGTSALSNNTTGYSNIAAGTNALLLNTIGKTNIGIGVDALNKNTTGQGNIGIGESSLYSNTNSTYNTAVGERSMFTNTTGSQNVAIGRLALFSNVTGHRNVAIGNLSLFDNVGDENVAIGDSSMFNNQSGYLNTAIGRQSLLALTTGFNNTGVGSSVSSFITSGDYNTAVGRNCLDNIVTGNNNTALGYSADVLGGGAAFSNITSIGYNATVQASNEIRIGNSSINEIGGWAPWTDVSDARFKKDIKEDVPGLAFIQQLRPVTYHMNMDAIAEHLREDYERDDSGQLVYLTPDAATVEARIYKSSVLNTGFIAQEVEAAAQSIGYDFYGVNPPSNPDDTYGLRYSVFTVPLVKAVQELSQENESLKSAITNQSMLLQQYKDELAALRSEIEQIKIQLQN